jgi:subtilisin family serine protease
MPATDKEREQIELIRDAIGAENLTIHPDNWEDEGVEVDYLYRTNKFIVRDANLGRVMDYLDTGRGERVNNRVDPEDPELAGSTVLTVEDDGWLARDEILNEIDRREGHGAMGYDHLSYVCVHCCAAIEPEEVDAAAAPAPGPQYYTDPLNRHGAGVHVRVVDTGLILAAAQHHAWMQGVTGDPDQGVVDALAQGASIPQDGGHGTFTAGCVRVTAPEADVRVVNGPGGPQRKRGGTDRIGAVFESDLADLLRKQLVADDGAEPIPVPDILVVNFAGTTRSGRPPVALAALYDSLIQHLDEVLILAPAGNEGDRRNNWPASFAWVVSVGALGEYGQRAPWSNHGRSVDVYAPGDRLVNAYATGDYDTKWETPSETRHFHGMARWSGTSFATPLVAGLVASRMSSTGQSSRRAWQSLLDLAERQAVPDLGPVLYPGQELA